MKSILKITIALIALFVLLTSCKNLSPANSESTLAETTNTEKQVPRLRLLTSQQGIVMTAGGETLQGCYQLDPYNDGTADIIYYDYNTLNCVRLSSQPNIGHDKTSTAYVASTMGGARCLVSGEVLYVLKNGLPYSDSTKSDTVSRLIWMNLDGSERGEQEYGSGLSFPWSGCVAGDETGRLFSIVSVVDAKNPENSQVVLAAIGKDVAGYDILYTWPVDASIKLGGVYDEGFLIEETKIVNGLPTTQLCTLQYNTHKTAPILEWNEFEISSYAVCNNILYYTKAFDTVVYRISLHDATSLAALPLTGMETSPAPVFTRIQCEVRDNRLILQVGDGNTIQSVAMHLKSGSCQRMTLTYKEAEEDNMVGIFAEGEKDFLVCIGEFTRTRSDYGPDGTPFTFAQAFMDYVLISKEAYWENAPEYRRFTYYDQ